MLDTSMTRSRHNLTVDGVSINVSSMHDAVTSVIDAVQRDEKFSVFTLNLDHVVQLEKRIDFRNAYRRAKFVTADGFPIVILGKLLGTDIQRTTGADLIEPLCAEAQKRNLPIFLLGSNSITLAATARALSKRYRGINLAGFFAPGPNFDPYSPEADFAMESIRRSGARLCFLALGAPKQEVFAARCLERLEGTGFLCIGAGLDFIAGTQTRAPTITQKIGLEWAWRMVKNPKRLGPRYAKCMAAAPKLLVKTLPQIINARVRRTA